MVVIGDSADTRFIGLHKRREFFHLRTLRGSVANPAAGRVLMQARWSLIFPLPAVNAQSTASR
jgi:hypothetical protein